MGLEQKIINVKVSAEDCRSRAVTILSRLTNQGQPPTGISEKTDSSTMVTKAEQTESTLNELNHILMAIGDYLFQEENTLKNAANDKCGGPLLAEYRR